MKQEKIVAAVKIGLTEFFKSPEGEALIGTIMLKAVAQSLDREMVFEDGKSEPGRTVEKTERVNVLDVITKYIPDLEGALRGVQADAGAARNRASETRDMLAGLLSMLPPAGEVIDATPRPPQLDGAGQSRTDVAPIESEDAL